MSQKTLIGNLWDEILSPIFQSDAYQNLRKFLKYEYSHHTVYPDMYDIFNAFKLTPPDKVKVVILGQDPYINPNQAHGLAFSVKEPTVPPPSLQNIYKEISDDLHITRSSSSGSLISWADQGVLLLNSVLTVRSGLSNSHRNRGWEELTSFAVKYLASVPRPIVFLLWGAGAQGVYENATRGGAGNNHLVLRAPHPSPLSAGRGFFGCGHFSKTNDFLIAHGVSAVDWS
ncbi:MAG: uracil-DNA glycosylase [Oscillospiraceae bacterium]|jgi:uracil-DNA glycosylase|nr:uracil-DNA glycosylase [Oscillospiraceae bacterium]